jgi:hypothetical protein
MTASPGCMAGCNGAESMIPKSMPTDLIRGWETVFGKDHAQTKSQTMIRFK